MTPSEKQIKRWAKLLEAKYRKKEQAFLAEGGKVVSELLVARWPVECLIIMEDKRDRWANLGKENPQIPCYFLQQRDFKRLSQDKEPEGIIGVAKRQFISVKSNISPDQRYLLLFEISNPNNLGAILRTAHWFGITSILISENSVDMTHPKVIRTSMGSLFHLEIEENINFYEVLPLLRSRGIRILSTDPSKGTPPRPIKKGAAILLGNETHGLPGNIESLCDECWHIPGKVSPGSLSLPQAAAILIYELTKGD